MGVERTRVWLGAGVVLVGATSVLLILLASLTVVSPGWFDPPGPDDGDARRIAQAVQGVVLTELTAVRATDPVRTPDDRGWASEPWGLSLGHEEANAWLATLLPRWLANQEWGGAAESVEVAQVRFRGSSVDLGVRVRSGETTRVLSARFRPFVDKEGGLWIPAERLAIGRLPIPLDWASGQARRAADRYLPRGSAGDPKARALVARLLGALDGRTPITEVPAIRLEDGRRVRLLSLSVENGTLKAVFRTEAAGRR
ncbi:MAG: hypothetical protein FJ255_00755 [Phycisphaerae bacterium]|nr:hypothetical protein [Phycisphaerae bacterium]